MFRRNWKPWLIAVAVALVLASASQANACGWGRGGGWGGRGGCCWSFTPCYSPCYSSCCDPCWSYSSCWGGYGYWGGCYSGCGDYCADPCCGSVGVVGPAAPAAAPTLAPQKPTTPPPPPTNPAGENQKTYAPTLDEPPATTTPPPPTPGAGTTPNLNTEPSPLTPGAKDPLAPEPSTLPPRTSLEPTRANSGLLTIYVPYDAKVTINGMATRSQGSKRQYVSYGLQPGFSYKYEVRAQVVRDGKPLEEVRSIVLTAGAREAVAFGFNPAQYEELAAR